MKKLKIKNFTYPIIAIAVASLLLFIILAILSFQNYHREKRLMEDYLRQEALTLMHTLEAGARTGMVGMMWGPSQIQTLVSETAKEANIDHIMLVDEYGNIVAHSNSEMIGETINDFQAPEKEEQIISSIEKNDNGKNILQVTKKVTPMNSRMGGMMERWQCMDRWNQSLSGKYLIVGLKMQQYEAAQTEDIRRAIISALILLILGSASFFFLFVVQNYHAVNSTLKSMETYTANVVESMPNGLISLDKDGRITTINQNAANLLGLNYNKVKGKRLTEVMHKCNLKKTFLPSTDIFEQQMECRLNDNRVIPLSTTSSQLKNENGEVIGTVIILRDLRDIKSLEEKVARSERLASLGRMAAGIAHEIRNPLSSIKGFAQYFRNKFDAKSEDANYAEVMIKEVDRLNRVIQDLLNFARPQEPDFQPTDILKIVKHSLKLIESDVQAKNVQIIKNFDKNLPLIAADGDLITQALLNIFINAMEAMDEKKNKLSIAVKSLGSSIEIDISDTGKGIARENLSHIFDPFFTSKKNGTGLGLAIVYRIIENHHGEIGVMSESGKGTTFKIALPK
ncbi:MAG: PAS domain S-box protein [Calditrichaeota bacterium]|nr:PAS domain S-box protein [Calditrichota bacterium]